MFLHRIGTNEKEDLLIYEEEDDGVFLDVSLSKDERWMMISANSKDSSEVRLIDARNPTSPPLLVQQRSAGVKYFLDHAEGQFFCVTNKDGAHNFKLLVASSDHMLSHLRAPTGAGVPACVPWREMVSCQTNATILDVDIFQDHIVTYLQDSGRHMMLVYERASLEKEPYRVPLPSDYVGDLNDYFAG